MFKCFLSDNIEFDLNVFRFYLGKGAQTIFNVESTFGLLPSSLPFLESIENNTRGEERQFGQTRTIKDLAKKNNKILG